MKGTSKLLKTFVVTGISFFLLFALHSAATAQCLPPPSGLVSWWPGDGNANDIIDLNDGTLQNGATFATGFVTSGNGQAFSFDGNGDFVSVPDNNSLDLGTGDFSIDAWIKTNSTRGVNTIMDKRVDNRSTEGSIKGYHFFLAFSSGLLGVHMADGGFTNFISSASVNDGAFHHVAVAIDRDSPTGGKLYVDGTAVLTFNPTSRPGSLDNNADFLIGGHISIPEFVFDGEIDELELYNVALSASEIQAIFNAGSAGKCKVIEVDIDIKPGSDPNSINPNSNGVISVAILTTSTAAGEPLDFDATTVDPLSVEFGPNGATESHGKGHIEDVDGDGDLDLVLHFKTQETGIQCGDTEVSLSGETFGGQDITGTDAIQTVGCGSNKSATTVQKNVLEFFALNQNYPNPFNPTTTIHFNVAASNAGATHVSLKIYDISGREVKTLITGVMEPGHYSVQWDSTNDRGEVVSGGVYIYRMVADDFIATQKMILLK